jgi:hypothetical protein
MSRDYNGLLTSATTAMLEKLRENEHKSGFDSIDIEYAIHRIEDELSELKEVFFKAKKSNFSMSNQEEKIKLIIALEEVRKEAADCANFAAMIIYKCDRWIKLLEA